MTQVTTLNDLARIISAQTGTGIEEATQFIHNYFSYVASMLARGEGFTVPEIGSFTTKDSQILFTPETGLRDMINEPFSIFSPIEIEDSFDINLLQETGEPIEDKEESRELTREAATPPEMVIDNPPVSTEEAEEEDRNERNQAVDKTETSRTPSHIPPLFDVSRFDETLRLNSGLIYPTNNIEAIADKTTDVDEEVPENRNKGQILKFILALLIGIIIGIVVGYVFRQGIDNLLHPDNSPKIENTSSARHSQ